MMQPRKTWLLRTSIACIAGAGLAATAEAGRRGYSGEGRQVVAESRYGNGAVVGSVRPTRLGPQVRTPGGNWLYCRRSCSETLRVNTVDLWETDGGDIGSLRQEDGLLSRWLRWERRY